MPYDYDAQIKRLTENHYLIDREWREGLGIFQFLSNIDDGRNQFGCGCITMIRAGNADNRPGMTPIRYGVYINGVRDQELTTEIANDERLPILVHQIEAKHLPIFKEYQIIIDNLGRK